VFSGNKTYKNADLLSAVLYAVKNNADAINRSLGFNLLISAEQFVLANPVYHEEWVDLLAYIVDQGTIVALAAGNEEASFDSN